MELKKSTNTSASFDGNPFVEDLFLNTWTTHYDKGRELIYFKGLEPLRFFSLKSSKTLCISAGANKTYGLSYNIDCDKFKNSNKIILIKDVHTFFNKKHALEGNLGRRILKRYPGFLVDFKNFENTEQYLKSRFSKNRIRKLRTYRKRFELCYNIEYKFYENKITVENHYFLFSKFKEFLIKRYNEKNEKNDFLEENYWSFQSELSYKLINEGKASLFVIFANNTPVNLCLNYLTKEAVILGMIAYDTDFERFNIGHLSFNKQLNYYYNQGIRLIDFSQSAYDYKSKICNVRYEFEYHIIYSTKSIKHIIMSMSFLIFYKLVTLKYNLTKQCYAYVTKTKKRFLSKKNNKVYFKFFEFNELDVSLDELQILALECVPEALKKPINYFLYKYSVKSQEIKIFRFLNSPNTFLLIADKKKEKVIIK